MKSNKIIIEELHHIPLFEALDENQLKKILSTACIQYLPAKTILFEAGQTAEHFYLLRSGQIKLYCLSANGDEKVVEIIYPSQTFAEAIMFMPKHIYPISAETITDSEVYSFEMKLFCEILQESQESCFRLLAIMSRHLHGLIDDIGNLTLHNATYRIVVYLLSQIPEGAVELSAIHLGVPKNVIASRLSIQPETFSRVLLSLAKKGLIKIHGNDITLLDVDGLRALL